MGQCGTLHLEKKPLFFGLFQRVLRDVPHVMLPTTVPHVNLGMPKWRLLQETIHIPVKV